MSNFNNEIILETDPYYSVISVNEPFPIDDIRNDSIYRYMANLDNFLETREQDMDIIPLDKLDKSGDYNNILTADTNGLKWQKISKQVEGKLRISIGHDETVLYQGATMELGNFNWVDNMNIVSTRIVPELNGGQLTTKIQTQESNEHSWAFVYPSTVTEHVRFNLTSQTTNVHGNNLIEFRTLKDNFDIVGSKLVDTDGNVVTVTEHIDSIADEKFNDIIKTVSATRYSISVIAEDGSINNWGQIGTADYKPPADVKNFKQVAGGYYAHVGLTDDGRIYGWGYASYTAGKIINYVPGTNDNIFVTTGFDFGLAINTNHDIIHWGSSTRVNTSLLPPRNTSKTSGLADRSADDFIKVAGGYKVAGALRRDGRLHIFGAADYYNLIANAPTYDDIIDFDLNYKSGVYLRADGTVGQWGSFSYPVPDFGTDTIVKVIAGKYVHQAITSAGGLYTWGTSTLVNVVGRYRTGVIDSDSYDYIGTYINSDYSLGVFTSVTTSSPQADVNNNAPSSTFRCKQSGLVIQGYDRSYTTDIPLSTNDFYIVTSSTGYHTYGGDYRDKSYMTMFEPDTYTLIGDDKIEIKYKKTEINTDRLTFYYATKTNYEVATRLQFDLDSQIIGE